MTSLSSISPEALRLIDPLGYQDKKTELKCAKENVEAFQRQVEKIIKLAAPYDPGCLVDKTVFCPDKFTNQHKINCPHTHTLAGYYAFNRILNPSFKTQICSKKHSSDTGCQGVHNGEIIYLRGSESYAVYTPQRRTLFQSPLNSASVTISQEGYPSFVRGLGVVCVSFPRFQLERGDRDDSPKSSTATTTISPPSSASASPSISPSSKSWSPWDRNCFDSILPLEKPL